MSTTSDGGFRRQLDGVTAWVTHASIWIGALCVLPDTVFYLVHPMTPMPVTWWTAISTVMVLFVYVAMGIHECRAMCIRCMEAVPADAAVRAVAEGGWDRRWLRVYHLSMRFWLVLAISASAIALLTHVAAVNLVWSVQVVGLVTSWRYHRLLRPWCPFCRRWGGGGDGDPESVPEPDPTMEKELT